MKSKGNEKHRFVPKKLKQILNKNKIKPIEIRTKVNKMKKMKISKTHSMENITNKSKNTTREKPPKPKTIFNSSMEDLDYLNFSKIDIDYYKKNSSLEEDIFNPKYYNKNKNKKEIVQNRYNMIDTSFDTLKSKNIRIDSENDYIDTANKILLQTPSTICNYYEKSEISTEQKNKNEKLRNNEKKVKYKKLKNKSIQIPNNNINNNIINNNYPIYSNRIKPPKNFSSSNITQNNNSHTKNNFYKSKGNSTTNNMKGGSKKKIKEDASSSMLKKKNKDIKNNILFNRVKNQNNLMKNYINNNIYKSKTNSNISLNKKKSFSTKNYLGNITSQILPNNKDLGFSNCNITYNNDISNYNKKKRNISNILKSTKENIKNNIIKNDINIIMNYNQQDIQNDKGQNIQKPIMLCLNKTKFNSYFITPTSSNSDKKDKQKNSTNSNNNDLDKDKDFLNIKNNITENYTGRNNQSSFNNIRKDIIVKRKKLNKTNNNGNSCTKSIASNININTTFSNYQNDKPIIKVNLKKHMKSSSELIKFINVDTKNKNDKNSKSKNNKSFVNTCTKGSINTSQVIKELLNKKKILKSPLQTKNNSTLKISKTSKENNSKTTNKIKTTPKYNKIQKRETYSTIEKKSYVDSNQKGYYSLKYELNLKNNNSNINKNKSKNSFKPKTQSDIKVNNYKLKEDEHSKKNNKENKDNNNGYGMDKRVKQKLLDRMNKVSKNNQGYIWGGNLAVKKKMQETFSGIIKSPNKDYLFNNNFCCGNKIISNENSKNEEKDFEKKEKFNDKRNQKEIIIIKEYKASKISNTYI